MTKDVFIQTFLNLIRKKRKARRKSLLPVMSDSNRKKLVYAFYVWECFNI